MQRKARSVRNPFVYVVGIEGKSNVVSHNSASAVTCDRQDENSASHVNSVVKVLCSSLTVVVRVVSDACPNLFVPPIC